MEASPGTNPSVAYIVCQKRITTKFITKDGQHSAPPGTIVMGVQGLEHSTFYINGTCPSFATAKPVRFIVAEQSKNLDTKMLAELSWALCHDYPNWAGPVKGKTIYLTCECRASLCFAVALTFVARSDGAQSGRTCW
jgi:hypothetical protein